MPGFLLPPTCLICIYNKFSLHLTRVSLFSIFMFLLISAGCTAGPANSPTAVARFSSPSLPASSSTPTANMTATPDWAQFQITLDALKTESAKALITRTPSPYPTPLLQLPISTAAPHAQAISPQNAWKIQQVAVLGKGEIKGVAWSPDGKEIAVAGVFGIDFYNVKTLALLRTFNMRGSLITYSPDGKYLAMTTQAGIQILDPATGRLLKRFDTKIKTANQVIFSPNGLLLLETGDFLLEMWDVFKVTRLYVQRIDSYYTGAAFSPDSTILALNTMDPDIYTDEITLLHSSSGEKNSTISAVAGNVAFLPNGSLVAPLDYDVIGIIDITSRETVKKIRLGAGLKPFWLSSDGNIVLSGESRTVYDLDSGKKLAVLEKPTFDIPPTFSPDGKRMAAKDFDGSLKVWNLHSGELLGQIEYENPLSSLEFMPFQNWDTQRRYDLATADYDGVIRVWDLPMGKILRRFSENSTIPIVRFSPDGRFLVVNGYREVSIRNIQTGDLLKTVDACKEGGVTSAFFSPDGRRLIIQCENQFSVMGVSSWKEIYSQQGIAVAAIDDDRLVTADNQGIIVTLDLISGNLVDALPVPQGDEGAFLPETFSMNSRYLAQGTNTAKIYVWDREKRQLACTLMAHKIVQSEYGDFGIRSLAMSPVNDVLASAGADQTLRLWNLKSGQLLRILDSDTPYTSLAFSSDGRYLAAGDFDGRVHVWGLPDR
jgi:WD40 repeat protein